MSFRLPTRGGKRRGAGRKSKAPRELVTRHGRRTLTRPTPVHVTIRMRPGMQELSIRIAKRAEKRCREYRHRGPWSGCWRGDQ